MIGRRTGRRAVRGRRPGLRLLLLLVVVLTACGQSEELAVSEAWARPTPPTADTAAFYVTIENNADADEVLTGASSDRCSMAAVHQSTMDDGTMSMSPAPPEALTMGAGEAIVLEPGGLHVMCTGVAEPFVEGESIDLELTFRNAGVVDVAVVVG